MIYDVKSSFELVNRLVALNGGTIHFHAIGYSPGKMDEPDPEPEFSAEFTIPGIIPGSTLDDAAYFFGMLIMSQIIRAYIERDVPDDIIWEAHTMTGINMN